MRNLFPLLLILILAPAWADEAQDIVINQAWVREAPPGVSPTAAYMEISNNTEETIVLQQISSTYFERVELHRTRMDGEMARMERKDNLTLSPAQTIRLQPGDYHLMLFSPSRLLRAGDKVPLTFTFKGYPARTIQAEIRKHDSGSPGHQHHH